MYATTHAMLYKFFVLSLYVILSAVFFQSFNQLPQLVFSQDVCGPASSLCLKPSNIVSVSVDGFSEQRMMAG